MALDARRGARFPARVGGVGDRGGRSLDGRRPGRRAPKRAPSRRHALRPLLTVLRYRRRWEFVVLHCSAVVGRTPWLLPLACGSARGRLRCPPELEIVLIHDYDDEPVMSRSLRYVGIDDFTVLRPEGDEAWANARKLRILREHLRRGGAGREYVMYCDSSDAVIRDDPARAIALLEDEPGCDLLFSSTRFAGSTAYTPGLRAWADEKARERGAADTYLNAGVFVGRREFLLEVLEAAREFEPERYLPRETWFRAWKRDRTIRELLPDFPCGSWSDQVVYQYLQPRFFPRMRVDYSGRLALRDRRLLRGSGLAIPATSGGQAGRRPPPSARSRSHSSRSSAESVSGTRIRRAT